MRRRIVRSFLTLVLLLALALVVGGYVFSGILLKPDRMLAHREDYLAQLEEQCSKLPVSGEAFSVLSEDGWKLAARHFRKKPSNDRFVVLVHGYGGSTLQLTALVPMWLENGFDVITFDHRNSGASEGRYITFGVLEHRDLERVFVAAAARLPSGARGGVSGGSMGGATVLLAAAETPAFAFVVSDCPFSDFFEESQYRFREDYPSLITWTGPLLGRVADFWIHFRAGVSMGDAAPLRTVDQIRMPVIFFCTEADRFVPPQMTRDLYARATCVKRLVFYPDGGHGQAFSHHQEAYATELRRFLVEKAGFVIP